ncbi:hypothetical protein APR04_002185 [Promicromonospora umidemergens]|nr:hypothetical protein [Promicromonospora umidemergens]
MRGPVDVFLAARHRRRLVTCGSALPDGLRHTQPAARRPWALTSHASCGSPPSHPGPSPSPSPSPRNDLPGHHTWLEEPMAGSSRRRSATRTLKETCARKLDRWPARKSRAPPECYLGGSGHTAVTSVRSHTGRWTGSGQTHVGRPTPPASRRALTCIPSTTWRSPFTGTASATPRNFGVHARSVRSRSDARPRPAPHTATTAAHRHLPCARDRHDPHGRRSRARVPHPLCFGAVRSVAHVTALSQNTGNGLARGRDARNGAADHGCPPCA